MVFVADTFCTCFHPHRRRTAAQRVTVGVGEVEVVNRAHRRVVGTRSHDAESLAHGGGRERAVPVDALEQVRSSSV